MAVREIIRLIHEPGIALLYAGPQILLSKICDYVTTCRIFERLTGEGIIHKVAKEPVTWI